MLHSMVREIFHRSKPGRVHKNKITDINLSKQTQNFGYMNLTYHRDSNNNIYNVKTLRCCIVLIGMSNLIKKFTIGWVFFLHQHHFFKYKMEKDYAAKFRNCLMQAGIRKILKMSWQKKNNN